ncbi:MAG: hypothetical protein ABWX89_00290 [Paeniglutamicibacter terrestris]
MPQEPGPDTNTGAMRLIFEYEGDAVRLISQQPVDMALTGAETPLDARTGHFAVIRETAEREIARVPVSGLQSTLEVFPETAGEPIVRITPDTPRGAFTVIVPAATAAASVALLSVSTPAPEREVEPGLPPTPIEPTETVLGVFTLEPLGDSQ